MTMHGNRDFILEAVKQNGVALQFATKELQRDTEVRQLSWTYFSAHCNIIPTTRYDFSWQFR
jgi:hypothetical protein